MHQGVIGWNQETVGLIQYHPSIESFNAQLKCEELDRCLKPVEAMINPKGCNRESDNAVNHRRRRANLCETGSKSVKSQQFLQFD